MSKPPQSLRMSIFHDRPIFAGCLLALASVPFVFSDTGAFNHGPRDWPYLLGAIVFASPLIVLFSRPEWTVIASLPLLVTQLATPPAVWMANAVPLAGLAGITAKRDQKSSRWWVLAGLVAAAILAVHWQGPRRDFETRGIWFGNLLGILIANVLVLAGSVLVGRVIRVEREKSAALEQIATQLEAERELDASLAVAEERNRIAMDLHDHLAHNLVVVSVQTEAARIGLQRKPLDDGAVAAVLRAIETAQRSAKDALQATRSIVANVSDRPASASPQPTLSMIADLVTHADPTGQTIQLSVDDALLTDADQRLSPSVQAASYRIVQEALTNAIKHGGDGARTRVVIGHTRDELSVRIENSSGVHAAAAPGAGHGLVNMRTRAEAAGGYIDARPTQSGFLVHALLPLRPESS